MMGKRSLTCLGLAALLASTGLPVLAEQAPGGNDGAPDKQQCERYRTELERLTRSGAGGEQSASGENTNQTRDLAVQQRIDNLREKLKQCE